MLDKVRETIRKYGMLKKGDGVVIGVSGGADSVALLFLLNFLRKEFNLTLHIAHLNHKLRGQESEEDLYFVNNLADKLRIPIALQEEDVSKKARIEKQSVEEVGRQLRYDFFVKVAQNENLQRIAVGHTRDDQAETILMHIIRGSGLSGLCGIPPTRKFQGCLIIRPLIEISRTEIEDYLQRKGIAARCDSSNKDTRFFRNRVRNKLLPLLEKEYNPNIKEILINFAENINIDFKLLDKITRRHFRGVSKREKDKIIIDLKKFSHFKKASQRMIVREAIKELKGDLRRIDYRHWKELEDLVGRRKGNAVVDLPQGLRAIKKKKEELIFSLKT
jgi:tRNA(Ile)-lysidine synthase